MADSNTTQAEAYCPVCQSVRMAHCSDPARCGNALALKRRVWATKVWWDGETLQVKPVYEDEALRRFEDE
jgi:hypothetical protein